MRIVMFYHSARSDWNHGNAHFLRGIATELLFRGHDVTIYEPENSWSCQNLVAEHGRTPLKNFRLIYPFLKIASYDLRTLELEKALGDVDLVIVHEWNDPQLVKSIGRFRRRSAGCRVLFHDTHHRMATAAGEMAAYDLEDYDGVLACGDALRGLYESSGRVRRAWTWHEAADTRVFYPRRGLRERGDLVWVGNLGDGERTAEITEFLLKPIQSLSLRACFHGVRYPQNARDALAKAGIEYAGWLPNFEVPGVLGQYKVTVHVPRHPFVEALPGIPAIRIFEALACGIPLICSSWNDSEGLFNPGCDFLVVRNGKEMASALRSVLHDRELAQEIAQNGLNTVLTRHTCVHRVDELLAISAELRPSGLKELKV